MAGKEYLRLMGFRDKDYQRMKDAGITDQQICTLAGNSICVPVLEAIFRRLCELQILCSPKDTLMKKDERYLIPERKNMYTNEDVEKFLLKARERKEEIIPEISKVAKGFDAVIIERVIRDSEFVAEDFCRYDSDVCEEFLTLMELVGIAGK